MKTGPIASYMVEDPAGIQRGGEHLRYGAIFRARPGVHVRRWLAAGRIRVVPGKRVSAKPPKRQMTTVHVCNACKAEFPSKRECFTHMHGCAAIKRALAAKISKTL